MSKRDLKKYLTELTKVQLEEQILELYEKFIPVKTFYDFVFNPKEENLLKEAKIKIANEYFPIQSSGKRRRPKMRRSTAQKFIKHFIQLGVDPFIVADVMLFALEIAQTFVASSPVKQESFYKSMFTSFQQALQFIKSNGIVTDFNSRLYDIAHQIDAQNWYNKAAFAAAIEQLESED